MSGSMSMLDPQTLAGLMRFVQTQQMMHQAAQRQQAAAWASPPLGGPNQAPTGQMPPAPPPGPQMYAPNAMGQQAQPLPAPPPNVGPEPIPLNTPGMNAPGGYHAPGYNRT